MLEKTLNNYQLVRLLGQGGMGSVYKAQDRELNRLVALKVIRPELARNAPIVDRFKQELRLSHQVTHRNVVRMYDLAEDAGMRFVTMELVAGQDLRSILQERGKLPPASPEPNRCLPSSKGAASQARRERPNLWRNEGQATPSEPLPSGRI